MSEQDHQQEGEKKHVATVDPGDQFSEIYGDWGRWQLFCFLLVGFTVVICCQPTLIMTFMNAKIDFWCQRPENLRDLDINDWKALSGGQDENCKIRNLSYSEMTLTEALRYCRIDHQNLTFMKQIWVSKQTFFFYT